MAAANESQGLKIAVAVLVSLTVILAVSSYFLYSSGSQASAKLEDEKKKADSAQALATKAVGDLQDFKDRAGFKGIEEYEALKTAMSKFFDKVTNDVSEINAESKKRVAEYQQAGGADPKIKELQDSSDQLLAAYRDEPNKTLGASIDRLRELLRNQAYLTVEFAIDNMGIRHDLESADVVNAEKLGQETDAFNKSKADLEAEHAEHEKNRQDLLAKVDKLQTDLANTSTELETLKTKSTQMKDDYDKKIKDFQVQVAFLKEEVQKEQDIMDRPDGYVTSVDYTRREVMTNATRQMGARPMMQFSIFDSRGPIPNKHPKAHIELISVNDRGSLARILPPIRAGQNLQSTADIEDPIRQGDFVYSAVWSPNTPERFALIGKIDMNRDGRDDRDDLKRMIEASGGIVEYDLPPPGAGRESGKLTSLCNKYVIDDLTPLASPTRRSPAGASQEDLDFLKKQTEAIREARSLGVQPITIDRLLIYMGYTPHMVASGRVENLDKKTSDAIVYPRGNVPAAATGGSATPPAAPGGTNGTPKEDNADAPK